MDLKSTNSCFYELSPETEEEGYGCNVALPRIDCEVYC